MPEWEGTDTEAAKVVQGWAFNDANDPHAREALESRIAALVHRAVDEQREANAKKCDAIADRCIGAEGDVEIGIRECAAAIRKGKEG